ncbi:MAG: hypothetical protein RI841_11170, partial [Halomonas sp.]|nr:hypothetical protein [Halomonas sp.]
MIFSDAFSWLPIDPSFTAASLILLGMILSTSILADVVASRTRLPRISLLVLVGVGVAVFQQVVLGQEGGAPLGGLSEPLIQVALVMVAFLLGGELTLDRLRSIGPLILIVSISVIGVGALAVGAGLLALGFPVVVAVALAAISVATDPAAVQETVRASGDTRLRARLLLGIVAIDDGWGIVVFGLAMAMLGWMLSGEGELALIEAAWELGGALLLGGGIGLPAAWLTGRLAPDHKTIADFRKDNGPAIRKVCAQFVELCRQVGLAQVSRSAGDLRLLVAQPQHLGHLTDQFFQPVSLIQHRPQLFLE